MKEANEKSLIFGLLCSPVGLLVGIYQWWSAIGDYSSFPIASTLGAFVMPSLVWYWLVERKSKFTNSSGILAGCIGVVAAHWLTFYLGIVIANIEYWIFGMKVGSLSGAPINIVFGLFAVLLYMTVSLIIYGWLTVPIGACIGWIYARYRRTGTFSIIGQRTNGSGP